MHVSLQLIMHSLDVAGDKYWWTLCLLSRYRQQTQELKVTVCKAWQGAVLLCSSYKTGNILLFFRCLDILSVTSQLVSAQMKRFSGTNLSSNEAQIQMYILHCNIEWSTNTMSFASFIPKKKKTNEKTPFRMSTRANTSFQLFVSHLK